MSNLQRTFIAAILFCILIVTLLDVAGRFLFDAPLLGADDLVRFGMALMVYGALPEICRTRRHITVDLLSGFWSAQVRILLSRLFALTAVVVLAVIAWRLIEVGLNALDYGDRSPLIRLPMAPLAFVMAGCALLAGSFELRHALLPRQLPPGGQQTASGIADSRDG